MNANPKSTLLAIEVWWALLSCASYWPKATRLSELLPVSSFCLTRITGDC